MIIRYVSLVLKILQDSIERIVDEIRHSADYVWLTCASNFLINLRD